MEFLKFVACLFVLIQVYASEERKSYAGYKVIQVLTPTEDDVIYLRQLMNSRLEINFWKEPSASDMSTFSVDPENYENILKLLTKRNLFFYVSDDDLQLSIDNEREEIERLKSASQYEFDLNNYHSLDDLYTWMDSLVAKCPKSFACQVYSIGHSHLGTPIKAFKITKESPGRKSWYLDATTHAREWISTATITNIINHLVTVGDKDAQNLIDKYDWYFVPVVNPDGYRYTWEKDRMWRKNRHQFKTCYGVDLNRNFNSTNWGTDGVSNLECSETYRGPSAGSEAEVRAVSAELRRLAPRTLVAYTMHSYGNMYLIPFGNLDKNKKCLRSKDHDEVMKAVEAMAVATEATHSTKWTRGNACEVIYPTSGSTDDFAKDISIKYSICPELRGRSFVVPSREIPLSFKEIFNGIVAMEKIIK
ncbi:hypothetical protein HELRODRAFT_185228 [Helobdella robusta]|uniref:Peptidase M14 domain-containing protein n=1 Tax=Helobdella robusta TaxID=6412 RepID=T1FMJ3_HELRO|nr:hypothetical protein HELRODRAFT_185228 [Helobdella robusta]ESO11499.1 hypothetical protein HELRODRAFT_185228 [Helobdella robusta]